MPQSVPATVPTFSPGAQWDRLINSVDAINAQLSSISHQLEPKGFFEQMHAPDWIQAGLLLLAIVALLYTRGSLKEASKGRDVENYYQIVRMFTAGFDRFAKADANDKYIEFIALVNLFESTCHLYNEKLFGKATARMVQDYLRRMLPQLWKEPIAHDWIQKAVKNDLEAFEEIRLFARHQNLKLETETAKPGK